MESGQYRLCVEVLRRLDRARVLDSMVLVGSWCTVFYADYFGAGGYRAVLRTRDMDLLVPRPRALRGEVDTAELLRDLGFVVGFTGAAGYMRLEHPELIVEFLVPERGRGSDRPHPLPQLGMNAQALRFMEFVGEHTIDVFVEGIRVAVPHPAAFALHKLLVLGRRGKPDKQMKDREAAERILGLLRERGQGGVVREMFAAMPKRWQARIIKELRGTGEAGMLE